MENALSQEKINKNWSYYLKCLLGIAFMVGFRFIPPINPITELGMNVLGIFIGVIYCWTFVDAIWPSILSIILLGLSGYSSMNQIVLNSFGNTIVVQMVFMMIFIGIVQEEKVSEYIARWFITRKVINGRPWIFTFMFLLGAYTIAALASTVPTIMLFWPIAYSIFKDLGYKPGDKYVNLLLISVTLAVAMGGATVPYKEGAMILLGNYFQLSGITIDFSSYLFCTFLLSLSVLITLVLSMKFIIRPDVKKLQEINVEMFEKNKLPPMNRKQIFIFKMLIAFILLMLAPPLMPKNLMITAFLNKLSPLGISIILPVILCIVKIDGEPIINFKKIANKYLSWEAYFLVISALIVGSVLTSKDTGINEFLKLFLNPLFEGKRIFMISLLIIILGMILTNLCNSVVMGMLLMPISISVASSMEMNSMFFVVLAIFSVLAFPIITPAASPYSAMAHANTEWLKPKDIYLYSSVITVVILFCVIVFGIPLIDMFMN